MSGNQPAFPCPVGQGTIFSGMNLRDYFAAAAMQAGLIRWLDQGNDGFDVQVKVAATLSYVIADAMIAERAL